MKLFTVTLFAIFLLTFMVILVAPQDDSQSTDDGSSDSSDSSPSDNPVELPTDSTVSQSVPTRSQSTSTPSNTPSNTPPVAGFPSSQPSPSSGTQTPSPSFVPRPTVISQGDDLSLQSIKPNYFGTADFRYFNRRMVKVWYSVTHKGGGA
ncbi:hypothetical protein GLOIN_2v1701128 [Rhizophagus irregularis DAOM 181602=DAOM 197198]|nr:hypothetical protein GLOIN_2v1701128 [Rhizophagus irregularis DAOM 181602=DAOM 197198]CAG8680905.1 872_t:CDS:2 [Rhizophagus irregularis]